MKGNHNTLFVDYTDEEDGNGINMKGNHNNQINGIYPMLNSSSIILKRNHKEIKSDGSIRVG